MNPCKSTNDGAVNLAILILKRPNVSDRNDVSLALPVSGTLHEASLFPLKQGFQTQMSWGPVALSSHWRAISVFK